MEIWRPLLPDSLAGRLLARVGPPLRSRLARSDALRGGLPRDRLLEVCGDRLFGREVWDAIVDETAILADYYHLFDRMLLSEDPYWWGGCRPRGGPDEDPRRAAHPPRPVPRHALGPPAPGRDDQHLLRRQAAAASSASTTDPSPCPAIAPRWSRAGSSPPTAGPRPSPRRGASSPIWEPTPCRRSSPAGRRGAGSRSGTPPMSSGGCAGSTRQSRCRIIRIVLN